MTENPDALLPARADVAPDAVDDATELHVLRALVDDLEREKATLTEGLTNRQHIGFVTGVLGQRYGLQPDAAWKLLAHISQELNTKAVRVANVFLAVYTGTLAAEDVHLAVRISDLLPPSPRSGTADASPGSEDAGLRNDAT